MLYPTVTVLVTVKNSKDTLKNCMNSLLALKYPKTRYKIIVVDAFSIDGTWEELKKYEKNKLPSVKLYQKSGSAAVGFNYGLDLVKTDLVALTDADCVVDKNWLKGLVKGFTSKEIYAVAGFCKTPTTVNKLQELIGKEFEWRFKNSPQFILRAPTMNLCFRTEIVKKLKFDEKFDVTFETDLGYRLTKLGKMKFTPDSIVYHYHRSTWKSWWKQQFNYGKFTPLLFFKHRGKFAKGDNISRPSMIIQPFLLIFGILFFLFGMFNNIFYFFSCIFLTLLFLIYIRDIFHLSKFNFTNLVWYLGIFLCRTVAWMAGLIVGIKNSIIRKKK